MAYQSLLPIVAHRVLHGGASVQGLLLSSIGVGSLAGALVVASMRRTHGYGLPVVIGATCFSLAVIAFSVSQWLLLSCLVGMVMGLFNITYQTQNQTLLQILTPRQLRGRVMSIYLLNRGLVPVGALLAGALASQFGAPVAIRVMSFIALGIVGLVVATRPKLLRLKVSFEAERFELNDVGHREGEVRTGAGLSA
jgi:MFS family permease